MTSVELIFVALINALAFWQKKHLFFFFLLVPVDILYGLKWAAQDVPGSTIWLEGVALAIIGTWCLYHIAAEVWGYIRDLRKKKGK